MGITQECPCSVLDDRYEAYDIEFEAVYMEVQQRLYGHLRNLNPVHLLWIEALLAEKEQALPDEQKVIRAQAVSMLAQMFTSEDWQAIADVAAQTMAHDILQIGQREGVPAATL